MTNDFDQHAINHMTVAIRQEMSPGGRAHPESDTLFMGSTAPSKGDEQALGNFGLDKNYKVVLPSFDATDPAAGPSGFHVVVTDGLTQSVVLRNGRLWKAGRLGASVVLFRGIKAMISLDAKGQLKVREMRGRFHERGYAFALEAVKARAAEKPGRVPVVGPIGALVTVTDVAAVSDMYAMAA